MFNAHQPPPRETEAMIQLALQRDLLSEISTEENFHENVDYLFTDNDTALFMHRRTLAHIKMPLKEGEKI